MAKKEWFYATCPGTSAGTMICTACRCLIEEGDFRYRCTAEGYVSQHRRCSSIDVFWKKVDTERQERTNHEAMRRKAYADFVAVWGVPYDLVDEDRF